jgi:acyl carrier protein
MPDDEVLTKLVSFAQDNLRPSDMQEPIEATTPLLEMGILDSLKTAILLNFIRDELGVFVPPLEINARNFKDLTSIAAMVSSTETAPAK